LPFRFMSDLLGVKTHNATDARWRRGFLARASEPRRRQLRAGMTSTLT
jgi:hypothetical protein